MSGTPCAHGPDVMRNGICECGEIIGPCGRCGGNAQSLDCEGATICHACSLIVDLEADAEALDRIAEVMSGGEWSADTLDAIAAIVRSTDRAITDTQNTP